MTDLAIKASRRGISRPGRPWKLIVGALLLVALAAACGPAASTAVPEPTAALLATAAPTPAPAATAADADVPPAITPAVTVADQAIAAGMVTVAEVVSAGPGWLVIHAARDGAPGPIRNAPERGCVRGVACGLQGIGRRSDGVSASRA